jgi:hypothetical protein
VIENRSAVFVAELDGGQLGLALPTDQRDAHRVLHRLLAELPPVKAAYVVPNSNIREIP